MRALHLAPFHRRVRFIWAYAVWSRMREQVVVDREEQEAMKARVREVVTVDTTYERIREALESLGFLAKEDKPALALWESREHELFVLVHMDPKTGGLRDYEVKTFEEMEGID